MRTRSHPKATRGASLGEFVAKRHPELCRCFMPARRTYANPALWQTPVCRMSDVIDRNGFRANVGVVLTHDGQVFFARRTGGRGWQFPQGGVRFGETLEEALF